MNNIEIIKCQKDILSITDVESIVNPVNLAGVMGKGLALQFRKKYPEMFKIYKEQCESRSFLLGDVSIYFPSIDDDKTPTTIVNFPTKIHWKNPSEYYIIEQSINALVTFCNMYQVRSIAIPPVGCGLGGLDMYEVEKMIMDIFIPNVTKYLKKCYLVNY